MNIYQDAGDASYNIFQNMQQAALSVVRQEVGTDWTTEAFLVLEKTSFLIKYPYILKVNLSLALASQDENAIKKC